MLSSFRGQMVAHKVKAHRSIESAVDQDDRELILGNEEADAAAKAGAQLHPSPSPAEAREARRKWDFVRQLCLHASRIAATWPPLRLLLPGGARRKVKTEEGDMLRTRGPPPPPVHPDMQHVFLPLGGHILCGRCLARTHSWAGARHRTLSEPCPGSSATMREALASAERGHVLAIGVYSGRPTVICITCGRFATDRVEGLASVCRPAGIHGKYAVSRFFRSLHPDVKKKDLGGEAFCRVLRGSELQKFTPDG